MLPLRLRPHRIHWLWDRIGDMITGYVMPMRDRIAYRASNDDPKPPEVTR